MTRLYRWLAFVPSFHQAMDLLTQADVEQDRADRAAKALRETLRAGGHDAGRIRALVDSVGLIDGT